MSRLDTNTSSVRAPAPIQSTVTQRRYGRRPRTVRGTSSVEAAIVVPVLLLFLAVTVAGARIALAQQAISGAAQAGARAASLERSAGVAVPAGQQAVERSLVGSGVACRPAVEVTGDWIAAGGIATATVTCRVSMADLLVPGLPGEFMIIRTANSPIDRYRGDQQPPR